MEYRHLKMPRWEMLLWIKKKFFVFKLPKHVFTPQMVFFVEKPEITILCHTEQKRKKSFFQKWNVPAWFLICMQGKKKLDLSILKTHFSLQGFGGVSTVFQSCIFCEKRENYVFWSQIEFQFFLCLCYFLSYSAQHV